MLFLLKKLVVVFTFVVIVARTKAFQPQHKTELKSAVDACVANDPTGISCMKNGIHISQWDVSQVTDMSWMFFRFEGDKWWEFSVEKSLSNENKFLHFNVDLSSWDVSSVTDMNHMFLMALMYLLCMPSLSKASNILVWCILSKAFSQSRKVIAIGFLPASALSSTRRMQPSGCAVDLFFLNAN